MKITITQYETIAEGSNGQDLPVGSGYCGTLTATALGAAAALEAGARLVRIATDTAVVVDVASPGVSAELLPANSVEFFEVTGAQVLTFSAA